MNHSVVTHDHQNVTGNHNSIEGSYCEVIGNHNSIGGSRCNIVGNHNSIYGNECTVLGNHNHDYSGDANMRGSFNKNCARKKQNASPPSAERNSLEVLESTTFMGSGEVFINGTLIKSGDPNRYDREIRPGGFFGNNMNFHVGDDTTLVGSNSIFVIGTNNSDLNNDAKKKKKKIEELQLPNKKDEKD